MRRVATEIWAAPRDTRPDALIGTDRRVLERLKAGPLTEGVVRIMVRNVHPAHVMSPVVRKGFAEAKVRPGGAPFWVATPAGLAALAADRAAAIAWAAEGGPRLG